VFVCVFVCVCVCVCMCVYVCATHFAKFDFKGELLAAKPLEQRIKLINDELLFATEPRVSCILSR